MVSVEAIKANMSELDGMSENVTFERTRDDALECDVFKLEGEFVTATLHDFDSGNGQLKLEYRDEKGGDTKTEKLEVPDEVRIVNVYTEDGAARMVVNMDDYGF